MACLRVMELSAAFQGLRFPVDVSGGVTRFRHRRGVLQRLTLELDAPEVEKWAAPQLRGLVGPLTPEVAIAAFPAQATLTVAQPEAAESASTAPGGALGFEMHVVAGEGDRVSVVVHHARGTGLAAPATALAIECVTALLGSVAKRSGALFTIEAPAATLTRKLLPEAGARAPATGDIHWAAIASQERGWTLCATRGALPASPTERAIRAREVATLLGDADEALVAGDLTKARAAYLGALERAPRHVEIVKRLVDIDSRVPGREEAALASIAEATEGGRVPAPDRALFGFERGDLLTRTGQRGAALAAFEQLAEFEPTPVLAARACQLAAGCASEPEDAVRWLDRALAGAPRSTSARWARLTQRLRLGRLEEALGDAEHLEALAQSDTAKHSIWSRAARAWQQRGLVAQAAVLFERALRFAPDDPAGLAGLGLSLVGQGSTARGVSLLRHALDLASARGEPTAAIALDLARSLADGLGDLSAAIVHVSRIDLTAREAPLARGLEGRWRARLGDVAGSSVAFARMRDLAAALAPTGAPRPSGAAAPADDQTPQLAEMLIEAAEIELDRSRDPLAAQRHLTIALRLQPHHEGARRASRCVGEIIASPLGERAIAVRPGLVEQPRPVEAEARSWRDPTTGAAEQPTRGLAATEAIGLGWDEALEDDAQNAELEERAEVLKRRLQADPRDDAAADELEGILERLGHGHELLALVSSRLEEASAEGRAVLLPRVRAALERLAAGAKSAGRPEEAALYAGALEHWLR
jgi:tetratricopeptide (TPR) repeat protein